MALPSSPPPFPEYDAPSSPASLPDEPEELPIRPIELLTDGVSRKRQFSDYGSLSSDPLFSEGTSDAEEQGKEERPRRKRMVRGPWFNLRRTSSLSLRRRMAKRERMRVADSGVWMGDDMSDDSVDSTWSSRQQMAGLEVADHSSPIVASSSQRTQEPPTAEDLAVKVITRCLDSGYESVDISGLALTHLSNATLAPLHQLIRHSHTDLTQPPSEDEFSTLTPSIQLFIYGNKLTSLPSELFRLTNITVLSLRNNHISGIPPCIDQLTSLQELNIAQNDIRWLPWEMLDLLHCRGTHRQITVRPNPLVGPIVDFTGPSPLPRPAATPAEFKEHLGRWGETSGAFFAKMKQWYSEDGVPWTIRHEMELRLKLGRLRRMNYLQEASRAGVELKLCNEQLVYLASSAVRYFEVDGSPCRNKKPADIAVDVDQEFTAVPDALMSQPASPNSTTISLFELALRSVQTNFSLKDIQYDSSDDLPRTVVEALQLAGKGQEYGNETCSACGKHFIIARAQWMEYWFNGYPAQEFLTEESVLPFLRRACSWKCAKPSEVGAFRF